MSRLITACTLIAAILLISVCGILYIKSEKDKCSEILQTAYDEAKSGNLESAQKSVEEFNSKWEKSEKYLMVFIHRQDLDEITFTSRVILEYIKSEELPEFYADLKKIMALLDHTLETEMPLPQNIL